MIAKFQKLFSVFVFFITLFDTTNAGIAPPSCDMGGLTSNVGATVRFFEYSYKDRDHYKDINFLSGGYLSNNYLGTVTGVQDISYATGENLDIPPCGFAGLTLNHFLMEITGYYYASQSGIYLMDIDVDDSAALFLGAGYSFDCCGQLANFTSSNHILTNALNQPHEAKEVYMEAGLFYPFKLIYINYRGTGVMKLQITTPDGSVDDTVGNNIYTFAEGDTSLCDAVTHTYEFTTHLTTATTTVTYTTSVVTAPTTVSTSTLTTWINDDNGEVTVIYVVDVPVPKTTTSSTTTTTKETTTTAADTTTINETTGTDSNTTPDATTIAITSTGTDTNTTPDATTIAITSTGTDTNTSPDATTIAITSTGTDTNTSPDATTIAITSTGTDTNTTPDATTIAISSTGIESIVATSHSRGSVINVPATTAMATGFESSTTPETCTVIPHTKGPITMEVTSTVTTSTRSSTTFKTDTLFTTSSMKTITSNAWSSISSRTQIYYGNSTSGLSSFHVASQEVPNQTKLSTSETATQPPASLSHFTMIQTVPDNKSAYSTNMHTIPGEKPSVTGNNPESHVVTYTHTVSCNKTSFADSKLISPTYPVASGNVTRPISGREPTTPTGNDESVPTPASKGPSNNGNDSNVSVSGNDDSSNSGNASRDLSSVTGSVSIAKPYYSHTATISTSLSVYEGVGTLTKECSLATLLAIAILLFI